MENRDMNLMAAIILGGMLAGESNSHDERTLKRVADLTFKLGEILDERRRLADEKKTAGSAEPTQP